MRKTYSSDFVEFTLDGQAEVIEVWRRYINTVSPMYDSVDTHQDRSDHN